MTAYFDIINSEELDGHNWVVIDVIEEEQWLNNLAKTYRELRTSTQIPISDIDFKGLSFSAENIKKRLCETQIPARGKGNFAVARSDFGETIAYTILEEFYKTQFGYKSLRDRELIQLPGRGVDAIGVEYDGDKLILLLGEVKTSTAVKSPPDVVDKGSDCLNKQHSHHMQNIQETASKIMHAARHAKDPQTQQLLFASAMILDEENGLEKIKITLYSCLVRQKDRFNNNDFGSFKSNPKLFQPSLIRFVITRIPGDLEKVVDEWLELARQEERS